MTNKEEKKWWEGELDEWENTGWNIVPVDTAGLRAIISKVEKEAYERGRQSILDELKEGQKKFMQGFAYKKPNN